MDNNKIPADWYQTQAEQAAQELDLDLYLGACETEIKNAVAASLEPMPEPVPDNSVYNFNAILDGLLD